MNLEEFWEEFLNIVNSRLNSISFNTWFKDSKLLARKNNNFIIKIDNEYKQNFINSSYSDLIDEILKEMTNENCTFELVLNDIVEELVVIEEPIIPVNRDTNSNLKPDYTFENFVVGNTNRLAQTVALSIAEQPGKLYNPLFIYGKSGLGKTHLMHAIGNFVVENSNKHVLYVTSEQFISDFTQINRKNDNNFDLIDHFKEKYRSVDVLIIDDIQFLGGATKTQDEFFNTFNELYNSNKQIIISSDKSPDDLKVLEERLRTRFAWGLTVNILPPDYELRIKILQNKIAGTEVGRKIKPEVLEYIANNCESDVRHLEGTINRLYAYTAIFPPLEINLEFATEALKDYLKSNEWVTNSITKIQKAVADYFNLTVEALKSKKRTAEIKNARQIAMFICKMTTEETYEKIGLEFNRDHATVIHSCEKVEKDMATDKEIERIIKEIKEKIQN